MKSKTTLLSRSVRVAFWAISAGILAGAMAAPWQGRKTTDPPLAAHGKLGQDLFLAIDHRDVSAVKSLLSRGADPNSRNGLEFTPLFIAAASYQPDVVQALLSAGCKPDATSPYGTALTFAAATGNVPAAQVLLAKGANVNAVRTDGITVLMMAATSGSAGLVDELLKRKADVNAKNEVDATALNYAARGGFGDVGRMLLDAGASVNNADVDGRTPLMAAAINGHAAFVQMLLQKGANVNAKDAKGRSALILSAAYGDYPDVIRALLDGGANADDTDARGRSAAALAAVRGYKMSAALLGKPTAASLAAVRVTRTAGDAIPISLKTLQASMAGFSRMTACLSCHQEGLGRIATGVARDHGFRLDPAVQRTQSMRLGGMLSAMQPLHVQALKNPEVMKQVPLIEINEVTTIDAWLLAGMAAQKDPATSGTAAMAMVLARQQSPAGFWSFSLPRVPMQSSFFTFTALSVRSLRAYGPKDHAAEVAQRIGRAKAWMLAAPAKNSEDRASRLLGLNWAGANPTEKRKAVAEVRSGQGADGGWSQMPGLQSDAYATGQALYALHTAGSLPVSDPVYKRGVQFLLRTQDEDGSWFVNKRAIAANNYFDSGFPHGESQYASFNGTCWATMALAETIPAKK